MDETTRQAARQWALAQPVVSAFITSVVRDFAARDDVLQEVAVSVLETYHHYDPNQSFTGWALGITRHKVQHYLRRVRRDRHIFDEDTISHIVTAFENPSVDPPRALTFLRSCLERLTDHALEICQLRYREDMKLEAIAARANTSPNNVAKILQRSRDELRDCIRRKATLEGVTL
jgi:RNA polymerase sigma-70 factor (ECF subfamily)